MENFAPGLRESILALTVALRVVLFFICVAGLILQVNRARADFEGLTLPIVRAVVVIALIATLPYWFEFTEKLLLSLADTVNDGYTQQSMQTAARLRDTVSGSGTEFSLRISAWGQPSVKTGSTLNAATHGIDAIPFPYFVEFDIFRAIGGAADGNVGGPGQTVQTINFQTLLDTVQGTEMRVYLYNPQTTPYA
jgi:hypothetical protein